MNKRITKETKAIADAHINARLNGGFDTLHLTSREEVIQALRDGKIIEEVLAQIEVRFGTITGGLLARIMGHTSNSYKQAVYNGFKQLLQN
tara:strand:- start:8194 stop:8466 length:273 start_codon:yes stop_codon:yes gene_type:complete